VVWLKDNIENVAMHIFGLFKHALLHLNAIWEFGIYTRWFTTLGQVKLERSFLSLPTSFLDAASYIIAI